MYRGNIRRGRRGKVQGPAATVLVGYRFSASSLISQRTTSVQNPVTIGKNSNLFGLTSPAESIHVATAKLIGLEWVGERLDWPTLLSCVQS